MAGRCWNSTIWYACPCASPSPSPSRNLVVRSKVGFFQDIAEIAHNKVTPHPSPFSLSLSLSLANKSDRGLLRLGRCSSQLVYRRPSGSCPSPSHRRREMPSISISESPFVPVVSLPPTPPGFSDSIFGLSVVYAALVMYDSQGVRREVGKHAKVMNGALLKKARVKSPSVESDAVGKPSSLPINSGQSSQFPSKLQLRMGDDGENISGIVGEGGTRLKESVGHTEVEVLAGAVLGFVVSMVVNTLM